MSAIGGMYRFGSAQVNPEWLAALGAGLNSRGPDGGGELISADGSVGMVHRAFHTTVESRLERQPLASRDGEMLVCDLRVDNRDELISLLRSELRTDKDQITDAAIIMAAYRKLGTDFLPKPTGELALALYDPHKRLLLLARDHIGARTLYLHKDNKRIIWSSEIGPLLDVAGIELEVEDEYVAGFLTRGPEPGLTPYKDIYAVKPAHVVIITRDGRIQEKRFWGLDPNKEIRYQRDEEYEENFRHIFWIAVSGPIKRSDKPVFEELSGGLDSSSIVCVADKIVESGAALTPRLETVSNVFDGAPKSDERKFIRYVEEQRGKVGHHIKEEDYPFLRFSSGLFPGLHTT